MNEDKLIATVLNIESRVETIEDSMATKSDTREIMDKLEGIATVINKVQEDHTFSMSWLKRLQTQVQKLS